MGFITNNANMLLLVLIVTSAVILVAATVFFQTNFDRINNEYQDKLGKLNEVSRELEERENVLKNVKEELTLKSVRESDFTDKYTSIRGEKEQLETTKKSLETTKANLEGKLDESEKRLILKSQELESKQNMIEERDAQIQQLNSHLTNEKLKMKKCDRELDACNAAKANCPST